MKLTDGQRSVLATAMSEALAFRMQVNRQGMPLGRPSLGELELQIGSIRKHAERLMATDNVHRAIVDRFVDAIAEGLIDT